MCCRCLVNLDTPAPEEAPATAPVGEPVIVPAIVPVSGSVAVAVSGPTIVPVTARVVSSSQRRVLATPHRYQPLPGDWAVTAAAPGKS